MKRKNLLFKSLLVAAGLFVGVNTSWADKEYTTLYSNDYEDATKISDILSGDYKDCQITDGTNHYLKVRENARNGGSKTMTFPAYTTTDYQEYIISFKAGFYTSNNKGSSFRLRNGNTDLASFTWTGWSGNVVTYNIGSTAQNETLESVYQNSSTRASDTNNSITKWYTFTITGSQDNNNVTLTVNDGTNDVISNSVISGSYVAITSLYFTLGNAHAEIGFDDMILKAYSENEVVPNPTAAVTAVNGNNRTVTMSLGMGSKAGTVIKYYTAYTGEGNATDLTAVTPTDLATYSTPFVTAATTIYYYAESTSGAKSDVQSIATGAGTSIALNAPTHTITGYNPETGVHTVTLSSNQTSVLFSPVASIYYSINDGAETLYSDAISVAEGDKLSFYAKADNYDNSITVTKTAQAPSLAPQLWTESYTGYAGLSLGDVATTINTTDYAYILNGETLVSTNLVFANNSGNLTLRTGGILGSNTTHYAILNLKAGDQVIITGARNQNTDFNINEANGMTKDEWNTVENTSYVYNVTASGAVRFETPRYCLLSSIMVKRALETRGATVGETGYATFAADVALDLSTLTEGFTAYFASSASNGKVMMTKAVDEKIAAGEGLFIQGTGAFTITETREATADVDNYLVGGDGVENGVVKEDGFDKYVLGEDGESVSFFLINEIPATVAIDKAYLQVTSSTVLGARLNIVFGGETTGISSMMSSENTADSYFNLSGQRVAAPQKGLYIVNGKKVIIK